MSHFHLWQLAAAYSRNAASIGAVLLMQSTVLIALGLLAARIAGQRSSAMKSAVLRAVLLAVLVCPIAAIALHRAGFEGVQLRSMASLAHTPAAMGWMIGIAVALVSMVLLTRLAVALRRVRRIRRGAASAPSNWIEDAGRFARVFRVTPPPVLLTDYFNTPCLVGCAAPAILLPKGSESLRPEVLVHELAHVRRNDCLWHLLARSAAALLWFQPLMWVLARRLEQASDEACDDFVVDYGSDRADYAHQLVDMAERHQASWVHCGGAVGMAAMKSTVARRVVRIMAGSRGASAGVRHATMLLVVVIFGVSATVATLLQVEDSAVAADAASTAPPRLSVPDAATLAKAEKMVRDAFGNYPSTALKDRPAMAVKMIQGGIDTQGNDAGRYALLKDGMDLAAGAGDAADALTAADALSKLYAVNGNDLRLEATRKASLAATSPAAAQAVAEIGLKCADDAVSAGDYDLAMKFLTPTETAAHRISPMVASIETRAGEIRWMHQESMHAKAAEAKRVKTPDDAESSFTIGRFLCLVKMDWKHGLPELLKGSNPAFRAAAANDLSAPTHYDKQVAAGDLWWDLAEKETDGAQSALRRRAAYWYTQAVADPQFAGLLRVLTEKRLASAPAPTPELATAETTPQPTTPSPTPAMPVPASADPNSVFSAAKNGAKRVLLFVGNSKEEALFKGIGAEVHVVKANDTTAMMANPQTYAQSSVIVWGRNSMVIPSETSFTDAAWEKMRHFMENGGDLILFEQSGGNPEAGRQLKANWSYIEKTFGIKMSGGAITGASLNADILPYTPSEVQTGEFLAKVVFFNDYTALPANATVLVSGRTNHNHAVVAGVPVGKGRLILIGTNLSPADEPLDRAIIQYIYAKRRASAGFSPSPAGNQVSAVANETAQALTSQLNDPLHWITKSGVWQNSPGKLHGEGDSEVDFDTALPRDVELSFNINVIKGAGPQMDFYGTDMKFCRQGDRQNLIADGDRSKSAKLGIPYANNQPRALKFRFRAESFEIEMDGRLEFAGTYKPGADVRLKFHAGDTASPGITEYWGFHVAPLPPQPSSAGNPVVGISDETGKAFTAQLNDPARWTEERKEPLLLSPGKLHAEGEASVRYGGRIPRNVALSFNFNMIQGSRGGLDFYEMDMKLTCQGNVQQNLFPVDSRSVSPTKGIPSALNRQRFVKFKLKENGYEMEVDHQPAFTGTYKPGDEFGLRFFAGDAKERGIVEISNFKIEPIDSSGASPVPGGSAPKSIFDPPDTSPAPGHSMAPGVSKEMQAFASARNLLPADKQITATIAKLNEVNGGSDIKANIGVAGDGTLHVDIVNQEAVTSIEPLYGLKVSKLNLDSCRKLRSLNGVQGMPLTELNLTNCFALGGDLSILKGMPLSRLGLRDCQSLKSLNGIAGMALTELNLDNCFELEGDLSAIKGMQLTKLLLGGCKKLQSLDGIQGMPLTELNLTECYALVDVSPLRGMRLNKLNLHQCQNLKSLGGLEGMPLTGELNLTNLYNMRSDLSALRGMQLTKLDLKGCQGLRNLDGIQGMPFTELDITNGYSLQDISALKGMPLTKLVLVQCEKLKSLDGLEGTPLKELQLPKQLAKTAMGLLKTFPTLETLKTGDAKIDEEVAAEIARRKPSQTGAAAPSLKAVSPEAVFADQPAGEASRKVLLFLGPHRNGVKSDEAVWQGLGCATIRVVKGNENAEVLGDSDPFGKFNVVAFGFDRIGQMKEGLLTDPVGAKLRQFVENGGDLAIADQWGERNWNVMEKAFGIKRFSGGLYSVRSMEPSLAAAMQTAGLSHEDIKRTRSTCRFELPENGAVLARGVIEHNGPPVDAVLVGVVRLGKGRVILAAPTSDYDGGKFNDVLFNYLYRKTASGVKSPAPAAGPKGKSIFDNP